MPHASAFLPSHISHDRANKENEMLMLITVVAAVAAVRGAWMLSRVVRAVPRSNADFRLPGVA
jgi:hypothetical protein